MQRLDKFLSSQGLISRKEACERIRAGEVSVNGRMVRRKDCKIDPQTDEIRLGDAPVVYQEYLYLMMNKPAGVLSASRDSAAPTVVDLVPAKWRRKGLFPAGRLDKDTEGLLILTDDGAFAHRMLSPKSGVYKLYEARVDAPVTEEDAAAFEAGLRLPDGEICLPAGLRVLEQGECPLTEVRICEGKFHQVKKMFQIRGKNVLHLKRIRIGNLPLDPALNPGECREIAPEERFWIFE